MVTSNPFSAMFGRSPFHPLLAHIVKASECADELLPFFEASLVGDWDTAAQHRDIWDRYLAFRPEIASRVRGLASQRAFLSNPDHELRTNLSYSTAIAWLLCERAGLGSQPLPAAAAAAPRSRAFSLR